MDRVFTVQEFCKEYKIGRSKAYLEMDAGHLKAVKIGKKTLIRADDAEKWLASLKPLVLDEETRARAISRHLTPSRAKSRQQGR
jgi:excisionase family DNA binding protein